MVGRVKIEVWSPSKRTWRTAYVLKHMLLRNVDLLRQYGFLVNVCGSMTDRHAVQQVAA